jgi:hypothetical protein
MNEIPKLKEKPPVRVQYEGISPKFDNFLFYFSITMIIAWAGFIGYGIIALIVNR